MSFQKTRGKERGTASNHLFLLSFFPLAKCFFLVKHGGRGLGQGGGDVSYFTACSRFPEEATAHPPGAQGSACEPLRGAVPGESVPSWDRSDPGTQSFHHAPKSPERFAWESFAAKGTAREKCVPLSSQQVWGTRRTQPRCGLGPSQDSIGLFGQDSERSRLSFLAPLGINPPESEALSQPMMPLEGPTPPRVGWLPGHFR